MFIKLCHFETNFISVFQKIPKDVPSNFIRNHPMSEVMVMNEDKVIGCLEISATDGTLRHNSIASRSFPATLSGPSVRNFPGSTLQYGIGLEK